MSSLTLNVPTSSHAILIKLRMFVARRRADRDLALGAARLAQLSPHLLADIGLVHAEPRLQPPLHCGRT